MTGDIEKINLSVKNVELLVLKKLNKKLERCGISYRDIAEKLEIDPSYIHKVLRGRKGLTLTSLLRICLVAVEICKERGCFECIKELYPSSIIREAEIDVLKLED